MQISLYCHSPVVKFSLRDIRRLKRDRQKAPTDTSVLRNAFIYMHLQSVGVADLCINAANGRWDSAEMGRNSSKENV